MGDGGGVNIELEDESQSAVLTNNTFFGNSADGNGGGIVVQSNEDTSQTSIYNNIVFGNTATGDGGDIYTNEDTGADTEFALVSLFNNLYTSFFSECEDAGSSCVTQGDNILGENPLFVDEAAGNFELTSSSPAIDTGDPDAPFIPSTDIAGNPRPDIAGTNPDIGAYEFQSPEPTPSPTPVPTATPTPILGGGGCSFGGSGASPASWFMGLGLLALVSVQQWRACRRREE